MRLRYVNLWEAVFPQELRAALGRRFMALAGIALLLLAAAIGLALASWSALDPSVNHATDRAPGNWLGQPGADVSDILMQFFGLGSVALALLLAGWGWRLASGVPLGKPLRRLAATVIGMTLAGGVVAGFPAPADWPLAVGLGGVLGEATLSVARWPVDLLIGPQSDLAGPAAVALVGALTLATLRIALGGRKNVPGEHGPDVVGALARAVARAWRGLAAGAGALARGVVGVWRFVFGDGGADPRERLRIAMARADDEEDLVWAGGDAYAPGSRRPPRPIVARGTAEPGEEAPRRNRFAPLATLKRWLRAADVLPDPHGRVEPELAAGEIGLEEDAEDGAPSVPPTAAPKRRKRRAPEPTAGEDFTLPPLTLLNEPPLDRGDTAMSAEVLQENARLLEGVLEDFGVRGEIINVRPGPVVTLYELEPAPGIKSSRVIGLADDIARSMSAISARVAVIPGRNAIGIELPNQTRQSVHLSEIFAAPEFTAAKHKIALALGKNIGGGPVIVDLARMPHLLIAGTTGSGKSVGINAMILSALFRMTPDECKLIMIDPKMLELSAYDGIPHLLTPVVTDPKKAIVALKWTVREMEERYKNMSKLGVRNIDGFNKRVTEAAAKGEALTRTVQTGFDRESGQAVYETEEMNLEPMPYIIVVVDEMADLMMVAGKDIEGAIQRLAQMARAAGIHLITATQRPSVDVITGTIKANFPTRVSFQVTSKIDSRTILGEQGAEQLLGQGDMLYMAGGGRISRVHGAFVSDDEVEGVVHFLKRQGVPEYLEAVTEERDGEADEAGFTGEADDGGPDDLYDRAVAIVACDRKASTSYIQRRLSIGYNRAATIIERMEDEGVVGPANHAGKREVLLPEAEYYD